MSTKLNQQPLKFISADVVVTAVDTITDLIGDIAAIAKDLSALQSGSIEEKEKALLDLINRVNTVAGDLADIRDKVIPEIQEEIQEVEEKVSGCFGA